METRVYDSRAASVQATLSPVKLSKQRVQPVAKAASLDPGQQLFLLIIMPGAVNDNCHPHNNQWMMTIFNGNALGLHIHCHRQH